MRFAIIGGLLSRPPEKGMLGEEIKKLSNQEYLHPTKDNTAITFASSTIERWYYKAAHSNDPISALDRKIRSDAGTTKAVNSKLLEELHNQYKKYPSWSYQLHTDNLKALVAQNKTELKKAPSYSTVMRRMKERGWTKKKNYKNKTIGQIKAAERLEKCETRGFEAEYVNSLWHLDFHEGPRVVNENGEWQTAKCLCILDDYSRLCCHIQWYLDETADSLIHALCQAFYKRGLPRSLMTDNGSAMIANETENGLLRLGIVHNKTLPYSPQQNGKQESFWGQLEGRLIAMLSRVESLSLNFLNEATQAWIEQEYNRSVHHEIKTSPLKRFLDGSDVSRKSPDIDFLNFAFTTLQTRVQRKSDGTISIQSVRFEIPSRFRHFHHITIRYQSWDLSKAYIVDKKNDDKLAIIYPQDKTKNSNGRRRSLEPISNISNQAENDDPIPPLLKKILSDYAATGLPPAYLPKNDEKGE